ncbi:Malonyl-CoA decarboxylase, mitochondrial-like protein [Drosera capensis]
MNRKALAILMRTRMRQSIPSHPPPTPTNTAKSMASGDANASGCSSSTSAVREMGMVREKMHAAISIDKAEVLDSVLNDFSEGYYSLSCESRRELLLILAKDYDLNRAQVRDLMKQYLAVEVASDDTGVEEEALVSTFYRMEKSLRHALKPTYEVLFERLNTHPGGLKFLSDLRADILSIIADENISSLRAFDSYLKEKLVTWLSPAALELHRITWDDPASLLEKIVAYEAVHPISSLIDLKTRLGVGRRCFGYLHPAIPGEPLIFIEEVLWNGPPMPEYDATCALFYSISASQPGLAGINLGKFLIKRVIELVKRDMPHISTFATLSPIPGYMKWLLAKLASQLKLAEAESSDLSDHLKPYTSSAFKENMLQPGENIDLLASVGDSAEGRSGTEVLWNLLSSRNSGWSKLDNVLSAMERPLMRLCTRYLLQEKKRGKALDSVANFHLQNGAV